MKSKFLLLFIFFLSLSACKPIQGTKINQDYSTATREIANWTIAPSLTPEATRTTTPKPTLTSTVTLTSTFTPTNTLTPSSTPFAGGGKIAFWGYPENEPGKLFVLNPINSELKMIFDAQDLEPHHVVIWNNPLPKWSPSGEYLIFSLTLDDIPESRIYLYHAKSEAVMLISSEEDYFLPLSGYWSKDGKYLLFGGKPVLREPPSIADLYYDADGKFNVVDVEDNFSVFQINFPYEDCKLLGHMADGGIFIETSEKNGIIVVDINGDVVHEYSMDPEMLDAWTDRSFGDPIFMGQALFFNTCQSDLVWNPECAIYSYDLETGDLTKLVPSDGGNIYHFAVSPNGENIVYSSGSLIVKNIRSGETVLQLDSSESQSNPVWSPDGKYILYLSKISVNHYLQSSSLQWVNLDDHEITNLVTGFKFVGLPAWGR